jgi:phosphatidylglycerophosphate synthase
MSGKRIVRSIWLTTIALFVIQGTIFVLISVLKQVPVRQHIWFPIALTAFHVALGVVLSVLHDLFRRVDDNVPLDRVNIPNVLSMTRVSSTPTILWLILIANEHRVVAVLASLTALVFLTDLLDGQISRRTGQVTSIGKYLDSSSDYAILFVTSIALRVYDLIALWVFILILVRLLFQFVAQSIIFVVQRWSIEARSTRWGKASVFAVMFLYALALVQLVPTLPEWFGTVFLVVQAVAAVIVAISLAEKAYLFAVDVRTAARSRK